MKDNYKNDIKWLIMDSDIVYVDDLTIKDRDNPTTHPNIDDVMKNIKKYYITSFNRDIKSGIRFLKLNSEHII